MTDIVERLRAGHLSAYESLRNEAAAEIERLRSKSSMADGMLALSGLNVDIHATDIAVMKSTMAKLIAAEKEIERLHALSQGALLPALIEIRNWCMVEGCSEQVDVAEKAMIAAGVKDIPCFQCYGDGQWDEGPLPARSSAQISPEYRTVICEECTGSGRLHFSLSSAQCGGKS
jgi:hypothetical protein